MRILVTGGSGFIGANYVEYLRRSGVAEFVNLDHHPPRHPPQRQFWRECDILDRERLTREIVGFAPTHVLHLAARTGLHETLNAYAANIEGVDNLVTVLRRAPSLERVVVTSSLLVCRVGYVPRHDTDYQPPNLYGLSKVRTEQIIRTQPDLPFVWTIIRPISVWGPWFDGPYERMFKAIARGWYVHIGYGHYRKPLGYVENTVEQIHSLFEVPSGLVDRKTMYIADEPPVDLHEFATEIQQAIGARRIRRVPLWLARVAAATGDLLKVAGWQQVPLTTIRLQNICAEYAYDLEPIMALSGPLRYELRAGVCRTVEWMRSVGEL